MLRASSSGTVAPGTTRGWASRSDIQNFQSLAIDDEGVAELDGDALRVDQIGRADFRFHFGRQRIRDIHHHQAAIAQECRRRFRRS